MPTLRFTPERTTRRSVIRARHAPAGGAAGGMRRHLGQERLRAGRGLRLLHGDDRRPSGALVPAEAGADGRARDRHARGHSGRDAAHDRRRLRARRRRAVRLLHSRHRRPRRVAHRARQDRRSRRDRQGARRPYLPLHRLRPDHRRDPDGGRGLSQRRAAAGRSRGAITSSAKTSGLQPQPRSTATANGDCVGASLARQGGHEQTLGEKPFVDDMRAPGMLHGAMVLTETSAREGAEDQDRRGRGDAGRRARLHRGRRARARAASASRFRTAGVCRGRRDHLLRGRLSRDRRRRHAVSRAPGGREGRGGVRGPRADHRSVRGVEAGRAARAFRPARSYPAPNLLQPITAFARGDVDAALKRRGARDRGDVCRRSRSIPRFSSPKRALSIPQGKGVKVHTDSQGSIYDQQQIARVLNLEPGDVEIALAASGGAFGAKEELSIQAQTAIAAYLLRPAGQDGAHARAVHAASRQAASDDDHAHGWRRRRRASAGACDPASSPMPAATTRPAPSARCAPRATRAVRTACRTSTSSRRRSTPTTRTAAPCAASAATRPSSPWKA